MEENIHEMEEGQVEDNGLVDLDVQLVTNDFVPDSELKTIMYQYNPMALKDIHFIEKGVENFFKFNQSHYALAKFENLTSLLPDDITFLESKNVLKTYEYIDFDKESGNLSVKKVIIRPASLKADQANKAIQSCIRGSAIALLQYIDFRDAKITSLQEKNELKDWVFRKFIQDQEGNSIDFNDKRNLPRLLSNLVHFSFETEIEKRIALPPERFASIIGILSKKNFELFEILSGYSELSPEAQNALKSRSDQPLLTKYTPDFHLIQPSFDEMVNMKGDKFKEINSEVDYIYFIFVELARKILLFILPSEESSWIEKSGVQQSEQLFEELNKHKSFTNKDDWKYADEFLHIFKKLALDYERTKKMRNDTRIDYIVNENLKPLNMRYDLFNLNLENLEIDDAVLKSFNNNKQELYLAIIEKVKQNRNVLFRRSKKENNELTSGLTMIYKENVPQAFIKNKNIRNLLNIIAKQNGYPAGIYDFLIPVTQDDPTELVNVQIALSKAIDEWIKEKEKEKIKKERAMKPWIVRILEFFLSLFGVKTSAPVSLQQKTNESPQEEEFVEEKSFSENKKKSIGVIVGPKEKKVLIPGKVQRAIEYVERNNKGLIWVDEVLDAIGSPQFTAHELGDMLFYDQNRRYMEIRSLNNIRHVFISKEKENDEKWIKSTIDYLDNIATGKKEYKILSQLLKNRLG